MNRNSAPVVSGVVAAVVVFVAWLLLDNSLTASLVYAVIVGLMAAAVTYYQTTRRR